MRFPSKRRGRGEAIRPMAPRLLQRIARADVDMIDDVHEEGDF
ncbi:MAG TPA: hypothetical protein VGZ27_06245 [Vicinamibacterales bacterium]|nr:hypothetical protein [Vicinamibacterales bacterium]